MSNITLQAVFCVSILSITQCMVTYNKLDWDASSPS